MLYSLVLLILKMKHNIILFKTDLQPLPPQTHLPDTHDDIVRVQFRYCYASLPILVQRQDRTEQEA